jgi:hypothetical protein
MKTKTWTQAIVDEDYAEEKAAAKIRQRVSYRNWERWYEKAVAMHVEDIAGTMRFHHEMSNEMRGYRFRWLAAIYKESLEQLLEDKGL